MIDTLWTLLDNSRGVSKRSSLFYANYLFNKVNAHLEIHAKVNESPFDAFAMVFFLLQNEHVMVKELLEFLIREVNAELFKTVELQVDK